MFVRWDRNERAVRAVRGALRREEFTRSLIPHFHVNADAGNKVTDNRFLCQREVRVAHVVSMQPTSGKQGSKVSIVVQYDQNATAPNVLHVLFYDHIFANDFKVHSTDIAAQQLTIDVSVPESATTGEIEIDLDGYAPIEGPKFEVKDSNGGGLKVVSVQPIQAEPYKHDQTIQITLSRHEASGQVQVFFPRSDYGYPSLRPTVPANFQASRVSVKIPNAAHTGRVRVQLGKTEQDWALTPILKIA